MSSRTAFGPSHVFEQVDGEALARSTHRVLPLRELKSEYARLLLSTSVFESRSTLEAKIVHTVLVAPNLRQKSEGTCLRSRYGTGARSEREWYRSRKILRLVRVT